MEQLGAFQIRTEEAGVKIRIEDQFLQRSLVDFVNVISSGGRDKEKLGGTVYKKCIRVFNWSCRNNDQKYFCRRKIAGSGSFNPKGLIMGKTLSSNGKLKYKKHTK